MARNIRKIEPLVTKAPAKKRVAAYARVSSGKDAMLHSLSAQISYYSEYIQNHHGWEYAGVYADEAVTGTKDNREEFQRLLTDCRNGKIDMIITKSISRFARNTITLLETVRELKNLNVEVFFEKENICSMSGDGELMLTILASFSQEESRSISDNCKWSIRKRYADGKPVNLRYMYGYHIKNGEMEIKSEEAELVRKIFDYFLSGMGLNAITKKLTEENIKTMKGTIWHERTIQQILMNEKYVGDMLMQKSYKPNHIDKKRHINKGELPKYYVSDSHEPIITREIFRATQKEIKRRAKRYNLSGKTPVTYPFTSKILCKQCGKNYRRKIGNASTPYARPVWICSTFNSLGKKACSSQQIPEDILFNIATEVLGLNEFDEKIFNQNIKEIQVPAHNELVFVFYNGRTIEREWENKSRSKCWNDEKCQQAQQKYLKGVNSPCVQQK